MSTDPIESDASDRDKTVDLLDHILAQLQSGSSPDIEQLVAAHPERAEDIRHLVSVVQLVHEATSEKDPVANLDARVNVGARRPVLDDYRIEREIGRGGMGIVYEATQVSLQRRVALKVLLPGVSISRQALERFNREAKTAGALHHTHIVPVYTVGENEGVHYYAMQFIEGRSLAHFLRQTRLAPAPFDETYFRRVVRWGLQMADALDYAHERGVIHRDIKPANIMRDKEDNIWLTDFGLARDDSAETITLSEDIVGTARYMAPEQTRGGRTPIDVTVDVYALGVTLYELCTLQPPFEGPDRETILRRIRNEAPRAPRKINPATPRDLETIILKALEKEPARRYLCAALLAEDLRRFQAGDSLLARRPTALQNARRFVRRHRLLTTLTAAAFLLLTGFSGWMWMLYSRLDTHMKAVSRAEALAAHESEGARIASDYLARLIASLDPRNPEGRDKAVVDARAAEEMLKKAREDITEQFTDRPQTQATLLLALGGVARNRGWLQEAVALHTRSLQLRQAASSGESAEKAEAQLELARTLLDAGEKERAATLFRECLEMRQRLFANDPGVLRQTLIEVARGISAVELDFALVCAREAVAIGERLDEVDSPQHLQALRALASIELLAGRGDDAIALLTPHVSKSKESADPLVYPALLIHRAALLEKASDLEGALVDLWQAYDALRSANLENDVHSAVTLEALARVSAAQGALEQAEHYLDEALAVQRIANGDDSPEVANLLVHLAAIRDRRGDVDGAHVAQLEALRRFARIYGEFAGSTNSLRGAVLARLERVERFADALPIAREQVEILREHAPPMNHASALRKLGSLLDSLGDDAGAEKAYAEALAIQRERVPDDRMTLASGMTLLARSVRSVERAGEAERLLREAVAIFRELEQPPHAWLGNTLIDLAWTLRLKREYEAAAAAGNEGLAIVRLARPGEPVPLGKALVVVASNLTEMGRATEAEPLLRECVELRRAKLHKHWMTASAESHLGECLALLGRFEEAEPLLLQAYPTLREKFGRRHEFVIQTLERIARLYELSGRPDQANEWRRELDETYAPEGTAP